MAREIVVELPRTAYYTGEVIEGTVVVEASRDVSSRGLYVDFTGTEETVITRQQGKESRTYRSSATVVQWRLPLRGEGILPAGTFRFPFRFQIPLHGLPSYAGRHAKVKYVLTARLDVPLWVDTTWSTEIFVFYDRPSVRTYAQPVRSRSSADGPQVYVELDGDRFFARELIGCRITLSNIGTARVRRVHAVDRRGMGEGGRPRRDDRDVPDRGLRADGADPGRSPVHVRDPHPRGRRVELPRDVFILQLCPPRRPRYRMGIRHRGADADRDRAMRPWNGRWREAQVNLK